MEKKNRSFNFKAEHVTEEGSFIGIANATGVLDHHHEIVDAGAFKNTIATHKKNGTMPALLWQHFSDQPIGIIKSMEETSVGLEMKAQLLIHDIDKAREAHALLKHNALNGLSIGFMVGREDLEFDKETEITHITEVDLMEVSVVTFPSNTDSIVTDVKNRKDWTIREFERFLRDSGRFSRSEAMGIAKHGYDGLIDPDFDLAEQVNKFRKLLEVT